jgi:hypothetical protein
MSGSVMSRLSRPGGVGGAFVLGLAYGVLSVQCTLGSSTILAIITVAAEDRDRDPDHRAVRHRHIHFKLRVAGIGIALVTAPPGERPVTVPRGCGFAAPPAC